MGLGLGDQLTAAAQVSGPLGSHTFEKNVNSAPGARNNTQPHQKNMSNSTLTFHDIRVADMVIKPPTKNTKGGMNAFLDLSATDRRCPHFQLAEHMRVPFGIRRKDYNDDESNPRKNMEVSLDDVDLRAFFENVDLHVLTQASENSVEWFKAKTKLDVETLRERVYKETCKKSSEGFAPLLRLKVTDVDGHNPTRIFVATSNSDGTYRYSSGTIDDVTPNSHVTPIVKMAGIWFVSKSFGLTLNCTDLLVYPSAKPSEFPFQVATVLFDNGEGVEAKGESKVPDASSTPSNAGGDGMDMDAI